MYANFKSEGAYAPDVLVAGNAHLLVARRITVAAGQTLERGAILGKVTADGKYKLCTKAATDGSQDADLVLAEKVDTTGGETQAIAYARGDFAKHALSVGTGYTVADVSETLRGKGILVMPHVA